MSEHDKFYELINNDPELRARLDEVADETIHIARQMGAEISEKDAVSCATVRVAALTPGGTLDRDTVERQLMNIPEVQAAKRQQALRAEIAAGRTDGLNAEIEHMNNAERMEWARKNLPSAPQTDDAVSLTTEEKAKVLANLAHLPPNHPERMNAGRKFGLI